MIGDIFSVNGKTYEIKKDITFKEYRKISTANSKLTKLSQHDDFSQIPTEELSRIATEFANANDEQLQIMVDFLGSSCGITQEQLDELTLTEAVQVFQEAFRKCTTPDKDLKKTSAYQ